MKHTFILVGCGWRGEFFLRAAKHLPDKFEVLGVVTGNEDRQKRVENMGFRHFPTIDAALSGAGAAPDFVIESVTPTASTKVILELMHKGLPVLSETPAARGYEDLLNFAKEMPKDVKYQMAEEYHLRPDHLARKKIIDSGLIGKASQAAISMTNDYHAISLIRKYLNVPGDNAVIRAHEFNVPGMPGFERSGFPQAETPKDYAQVLATLDFGGKMGIYDFENGQHRSFIRTQHIIIKGDRGIIDNHHIKYLKDYKTPMETYLKRKSFGIEESAEGAGLWGYVANGEWAYQNTYMFSRMTDDEIAVAECMERMGNYVKGGEPFYSFPQAAQDTYLAQLIAKAKDTGEVVKAEPQPWTEDLLKEY